MSGMNAMTTRRKLAIASWTAPSEGNIYGKLRLDCTNVLRYIDHLRATTGEKVTMTHIVGRAVGLALAQTPSLNGRIFLGRYIPHDRVAVAFLVSIEEGGNLAKFKVDDVDKKGTGALARELREGAQRLQKGQDAAFQKSQGPLKLLPTWLIRPLVRLSGWLTACAGLSVPALGLEQFPFGSCIITSVGMFGLDEGFAPHTPWAHVPLLVLIGAVTEQPAIVGGAVVARPEVIITATIDHRYLDGAQGGVLAKTLRALFAEPWRLDGLAEAPWAAA